MNNAEVVDYVSMGKQVRKYRKKKGWNQSDLADAVKMSNTTISHIEVGKGKPELNTVVRIANALDVTLDMLLCDSLKAAVTPYQLDIADFMADCSPVEFRLINAVIPSILSTLRRTQTECIEADN